MKNEDRYFEEIAIGESGTTEGRTVTETDVSLFSALTGEYEQVHNNVEYAREEKGGRIAQPYLILAQVVPLHMGINHYAFGYGFDDVEFTGDVYVGDTVRVNWEYTDKTEKTEKFGLVTTTATVENQDGEDVMVYDFQRGVARESYFGDSDEDIGEVLDASQ